MHNDDLLDIDRLMDIHGGPIDTIEKSKTGLGDFTLVEGEF